MFIHEIKNIVVEDAVVNGLAIKSSIDENGNAFPVYTVAEEGDKVGLIYATKNEDVLEIKYKEDYEVAFNTDEEKKAEAVKIFAYQGVADLGGKTVKGLFFKPVAGITGTTAIRNGENVVVIEEEVDGQALESPEISVEKAVSIACSVCSDSDELFGDVVASDIQSGLEIGEVTEKGTAFTGTLKYVESWPECTSDPDFHWFAAVKFDPAEGTSVNGTALDESGVYIVCFKDDEARRILVTADGYEKYYTFANCTFTPAPSEE